MNFRRWITALAVLTLFVGLAAAQTQGGGTAAMTCNTVAQVTPTIRSEGITELVGDIVITCQGGNYITPDLPGTGSLIPQTNIVVTLTAPVTSRLSSSSTGASEALLLIDEPNSGLAAPVALYGPEAQFNVCSTPLTGCPAYARSTVFKAGGSVVVAAASATGDVNVQGAQASNVFQGLVSTNQVTFLGVPVLPPVTNGIQRVYRITNIRVNATGAGSSIVGISQPIYAYLSTNGGSSLPISAAQVTVAFAQTSLTTSVTDKPTSAMQQCDLAMGSLNTQRSGAGNVAILNFSEVFQSAFKVRVAPYSTSTGSSYLGTSGAGYYRQNVPGTLYNSESGFILPVGSFSAGIADSGTRLKAVFTNLPAGATLYVSRYNVGSYLAEATAPGVIGGLNAVQTAYAALTSGEASTFSAPSGGTVAYGAAVTGTIGAVNAVPLSISSGTATAVWEVINTNTSQGETFKFAVYLAFTPNTSANTPTVTPATGGPQVTLSYAPIASSSITAWVPRFVQLPTTQFPIINIVPCQTLLLFPYVTTLGGFDTGIAISNTSQDPVGTQTSAGSCKLYFYGGDGQGVPYVAPTTPLSLGPIAVGTPDPRKAAFQASTLVPNFQGYLFALCDFQFAHGFAFVSDIGARNLAMGYLPLIVNNGNVLNTQRGILTPAGESLGN